MANILVVDDDVDLATIVEDYLLSQKHSVKVVHAGFEAAWLLESNDFDLAILDWDLPGVKGIDILKKARASGSRTPVIMLTGRASSDDKELGLDSGANDYLTKPFDMKELGARIRAVLRNSAAKAPAPPKALGTNNEEVLKKGNLIGTSLAARYEFIDVIGQGGFGIVFKARHPQLDKLVAVKMIQSKEIGDETIARFEREAKAVGSLDHPNIVIVHDYGVTENRQPYMVMEYIQGKGLDVALKESDGLPLKPALNMLVPVCDGLAHAHDVGILHRDIKPSNIMLKDSLQRGPVPKLLDFGMSKLKSLDSEGTDLTRSQQLLGSPPYMSPEQVLGNAPDERSDVYAFGCVIFETVTGYPCFFGKTAVEILVKHVQDPPMTFQEVQPDRTYPKELDYLVKRALAKKPEDRYQSMGHLQYDLETVALAVRESPSG